MSSRFGKNWSFSWPVHFEGLTRPFQNDKRTLPSPPRPPVLIEDEEEDPDAIILEIGRAGTRFNDAPDEPVEDLNADWYMSEHGPADFKVNTGKGDEKKPGKKKPQDDQPGIHAFDEMERVVDRIKVYDPEDKETYIVVERVVSIRFRGPKGHIYKFNLRPPPPKPAPRE